MNNDLPRAAKMKKKAISILGSKQACTEQELRGELRKNYPNILPDILNPPIEKVITDLHDSNLVRITKEDISLSKDGIIAYRDILAKKEAKTKKKPQKTPLKQKMQEVQQQRKLSKDVHQRLKLQLGELALLLGLTWKQEHALVKGGPVILDIVWYSDPNTISHAFEVQHRGSWKNAIGNLEAMNRYHPECKLYIVIFNERQINPVRQLLGARLNTSINIIKTSQVREWLSVLEKAPDNILPQLIPVVTDIQNSGLYP